MWLRPLTLEGMQSWLRGQEPRAMHVTEAIFATSRGLEQLALLWFRSSDREELRARNT